MLDMQVVLGMSTDREIIVRDLYYQGTNVDAVRTSSQRMKKEMLYWLSSLKRN